MKMLYYVVWLTIYSFVLMACSIITYGVQQDNIVNSTYIDKHTDCENCHKVSDPKGERAKSPPNIDPSNYCLNCHNYNVNHHPVNVVPYSTIKVLFPLYNGKITCLTCHDIHGGPEHNLTPKLLRGGPYIDRRKVCFECHTFKMYEGVNPHIMKDNEGNYITSNGKVVCLTCHEVEPDPTIDKANMVLFKADIGFLCMRCHPIMRHTDYFEKHYLKTPSSEIKRNMEKSRVQEKYTLPLVPRECITCSTCHNPHQQGVISYGPAAAGADSINKLRDENICVGCHL